MESPNVKPITIIEPKYVDSTNTRPYQPHAATSISNLWMAGGHARTSVDIWSMESAAEAGRKAADMITGEHSTIVQNRGVMLKSLGDMDDILYDYGIPSVVYVLIILILVLAMLLVIYIWYIYTKKK